METKDYLIVFISSSALVISIISTFYQKRKENSRIIRKDLTDTLDRINGINLDFAQLRQSSENFNSKETLLTRRLYNTQRRILLAHADYLAHHNDSLVTDIDCVILAETFSHSENHFKAELYWEKAIKKSSTNAIKHINLRIYGKYLYYQGKIQLGRDKYKEALILDLGDTDVNRRLITDTYILWSTLESEFNNPSEARRYMDEAKSACSRIGHLGMRKEMEEQIRLASPFEA